MEKSETEDLLHGVLEGGVNILSRPRLRAQTKWKKAGGGRVRRINLLLSPPHARVFSRLLITFHSPSFFLSSPSNDQSDSLFSGIFYVSHHRNKYQVVDGVDIVKTAPTGTNTSQRMKSFEIVVEQLDYMVVSVSLKCWLSLNQSRSQIPSLDI